MIEPLKITVSSPICKCENENISWGLYYDQFVLECQTCKVKLSMPLKNLRACLCFTKNYPKGRLDKKNNILTLVDGEKK